jgi:ubiquitin-activating enzyme E1-like protein
MWPRWPTLFNAGQSSPMGTVTFITQANPAQVTAPNHGLVSGDEVYIYNVGGMTQVNGSDYTITVVDANNYTLIGVDSTLFSAYTSGGTWTEVPVQFDFTIPGPFLDKEVTIGGVDIDGNAFSITDDGYGNLWQQVPNPVVSVPPYGSKFPALTPNAGMPIPGMYNQNTLNPGLNAQTKIGTVNYVTGAIAFELDLPLQTGTTLTIRVSQYQTGRPYTVLFWNNEFTIRPIPQYVHKIELEVYLTPVQFMLSSDSPILNQWVGYVSYGVAIEILRLRQDMEGVSNLMEGFKYQEGLVLERQGVEEIGQRNVTIFAGNQQNLPGNFGWNQGWY